MCERVLNPALTDEAQLLQRARRADLAAFNELVTAYESLVYNLCYRLLGQRQAAEDAAQEAFIAAWRGIARLRGDALCQHASRESGRRHWRQ